MQPQEELRGYTSKGRREGQVAKRCLLLLVVGVGVMEIKVVVELGQRR